TLRSLARPKRKRHRRDGRVRRNTWDGKVKRARPDHVGVEVLDAVVRVGERSSISDEREDHLRGHSAAEGLQGYCRAGVAEARNPPYRSRIAGLGISCFIRDDTSAADVAELARCSPGPGPRRHRRGDREADIAERLTAAPDITDGQGVGQDEVD